jgi:hypothetical protein
MTTNRYSYQKLLTSASGSYISTYPSVMPEELQRPDDLFVKISYGQRIDNLAYDYLGDGGYWWIICLVNGFPTPFENTEGKVIRIPTSVNYILNILEKKANA